MGQVLQHNWSQPVLANNLSGWFIEHYMIRDKSESEPFIGTNEQTMVQMVGIMAIDKAVLAVKIENTVTEEEQMTE